MLRNRLPVMLGRLMRTLGLTAAAVVILFGCVSSGPAASASKDVVRATLDNGLQVIIVRNSLAPVVTQQVTYRAGANQSPPGFPGMAHAQEHMMFRGSPGLSADQLSGITAQLGSDTNAYTASTTTTYYFTVPKDDLDIILRIEATRMAGVDDAQADWEKERGAIEQEVARDNSSPMFVLQSRARERIFAGTPYADTGLGTKESFDKTTADMLKAFHDAWYAPNNALLVIAGDIDPPAVLSRIKDLFGPIQKKTLPQKPQLAFQPVAPETFTSTTDQPYGFVSYSFRTPGYDSPDYAASQILAQTLNSPRGAIVELSYEGKALGSGFFQQTFAETGYATAWAAFPQGGDEKALAADLKAAVLQSRAGIPAELVDAESRRVVLDNALRGNSISGLAQLWTDAVAVQGLESPDVDADRLKAVSAESVNAAAARILDFDHAITLVLTPAPSGQAPQSGREFGTPESFASTPEKPVSLPPWAQAALAKLPHPTPLFTPTVLTLANGLRLIVQPLAGSGAVSLFGGVRNNEDLQAPAGKEGVSDMLDTLFEWGPRGMGRAQFEAAMDSIGAEYSTGAGFSLSVLPEYFDRAVELLSKDLLDPALPADAFASQKPLQARQEAGKSRSPVSQFHLAVQKGLAPEGDPSLRRPTEGSVNSLTIDDVKAYHANVVRPDVTTIVIMGKIEPAAAKSVIEKYFGSWRAAGPKPVLDLPPVPPSKSQEVLVPDAVRQQNDVVLAETLPLNYNDPDHYALALGNEFLGGDSFASPLYRELRVKRGLVYSVGSATSFGRTRSSFSLSYGASPDKVLEARQIAVQVIKGMGEKLMTEQELHLAKAQSLRQIELASQSASDIAGSWLSYSQEGLELDRLYKVARAYESLTAAQIQAAFRKYIDLDRLSFFTLGQKVK
ncbi:MAG TPA: pitrilysin family protein [Spirochaetia bacterium]|nr:pitrilysin family protein [Spirochaetia bacterium]